MNLHMQLVRGCTALLLIIGLAVAAAWVPVLPASHRTLASRPAAIPVEAPAAMIRIDASGSMTQGFHPAGDLRTLCLLEPAKKIHEGLLQDIASVRVVRSAYRAASAARIATML
ncbi:MAG: hypothetical protein WBV61_13330 [Rhodanobacteraceae bacterium]